MEKKCFYDYANSCTCAEDDNCGCDYDNNMSGDVSCDIDVRKKQKTSQTFLKDGFEEKSN